MSRGNLIIVSSEPRGKFDEGYIATGQTPKPGVVMQVDYTVALKGGRFTWTPYNRDADGNHPAGPLAVLLNDYLRGIPVSTAYAAGDRCFLYIPGAGDELNMLLGDVAGTADDHTIGELLIVNDGDGKLVATTGSPESEPFQLQETITDPTADTLAWVRFTGF
jgi:Zn-dependent M28 family amino/carboxypeptidase